MSDEQRSPGFQLPPLPPELTVLQKDVGDWDAQVEVCPSPGAPSLRSVGRMRSQLIAGGRWLVSVYKNETSGFEGHGVYGWDPQRGRYVGTWVDDMRSFLVVGEGTYDAAAKTMTYVTELKQGERTVRWRDVTETKDASTQVFRSFVTLPGGAEHEMMTVTYSRRR